MPTCMLKRPSDHAHDEGDADALLPRQRVAVEAVAAEQVTVVREEHHVRFAVDAQCLERRQDPAHVEVEVLDHAVVSHRGVRRLLAEAGRRGDVGPERDGRLVRHARTVAGVGRGHHGTVRRLHREHGEERLVVAFDAVAVDVLPQVAKEQVGEGVGLVAGESARCLLPSPVDEALLLVVVVVVAHPVVEAAAARGRHVVGVLVEAVEMPLAHEGGVVTRLSEGLGDGGNGRIEPLRDPYHAALVRVKPGKARSGGRRGTGSTTVRRPPPNRSARPCVPGCRCSES